VAVPALFLLLLCIYYSLFIIPMDIFLLQTWSAVAVPALFLLLLCIYYSLFIIPMDIFLLVVLYSSICRIFPWARAQLFVLENLLRIAISKRFTTLYHGYFYLLLISLEKLK